jgi:hypothetical protein
MLRKQELVSCLNLIKICLVVKSKMRRRTKYQDILWDKVRQSQVIEDR